MNWQAWAAAPAVERIGWTLLHFLWQGAAIGLALAFALRLLRNRTAQSRYAAGLLALGAMLVAPAATFYSIGTPPATLGGMPAAASADLTGLARYFAALKTVPVVNGPLPAAPTPPEAINTRVARQVRAALPWLALAWLAGVAALSIWQAGAWFAVQRLRRTMVRPPAERWQRMMEELAGRLGVKRAVALLESAAVETPSLIGWLRPVILLPASALTGLTPRQIEAILAHELAHIRRCDYAVNLLQSVAETLLFYHPAVWWVGRRIRQERENCCDDLAIEILGDARVYAHALTKMEELRMESSELAMSMTKGNLMKRIRRTLGVAQAERAGARWIAGTATMLALAAAAAVMTGAAPAAEAQTAAAPAAAVSSIGVAGLDLNKLSGGAKPSVEVTLDQAGLAVALGAVQGLPPELSKAVASLNLSMLKVRVFENLSSKTLNAASVAGEVEQMIAGGWSPLFKINDGDELITFMMRSDGNRVKGMTVVVRDSSDLIFVNAAVDADATELGGKLSSVAAMAAHGKIDIRQLLESLQQPGAAAEKPVAIHATAINVADPVSVAREFFTHLAKGDRQSARLSVVPEQREDFDRDLSKQGLPTIPAAFELKREPGADPDKALVQMAGTSINVDLRRIDGRWWVGK